MKIISSEESRSILLDITSAVDRFCRHHHIRYSIACGTLLGSVRHSGFIPWDDDMDLYMLREDYERFEQLFPQLLDDRYRLCSPFRTSDWHLPYAKVCDVRTLAPSRNHTIPIGLNIDIFILDDVPDDDMQWRRFRFWQYWMVRTNMDRSIPFGAKSGGWGTNIRIAFGHIVCIGSRHHRLQRITRYITRYNGKGFHRCFESVQGLHSKGPFDKRLFDELKEWPFEDRLYLGFADADHYLRCAYGDYMKLPPAKEQVPSHFNAVYWVE